MVATARTSKVNPKDEDIDLLAGMDTSPAASAADLDDDDDFDLLSEMSESDAQSWVPQGDDEVPQAIQGKLTHIGTVTQDAKYGGDEVSYWELQDKSDPSVTWGVRGYSTVLNGQMEKAEGAGLRTGDFVAVAYRGLIWNKAKTNEYHSFVIKTKHVGH